MAHKLTIPVAALALVCHGRAPAADFAFGFSECPAIVAGAPGEVKRITVFGTLTTSNNDSPEGAQGWSLSLGVDGATPSSVSSDVVVSTILYDDLDNDPNTTGDVVKRDPYPQNLGDRDVSYKLFRIATFQSDPERRGIVSAVLMKSREKQTLQPNGTERIVAFTLEVTIPAEDCGEISLRYENGFVGIPVTMPVWNSVTFDEGGGNAQSFVPTLGVCTIRVCPSLGQVWPFRRGDVDGSNEIDLSDAIVLLNDLFIDDPEIHCRDSADADDSGDLDITDAIKILNFLFLGGSAPPAPGPRSCGRDPTVDGMVECLADCR